MYSKPIAKTLQQLQAEAERAQSSPTKAQETSLGQPVGVAKTQQGTENPAQAISRKFPCQPAIDQPSSSGDSAVARTRRPGNASRSLPVRGKLSLTQIKWGFWGWAQR